MFKLPCILMFALVSVTTAAEMPFQMDDQGLRAVAAEAYTTGDGAGHQPLGGDSSNWTALGPFGGDVQDVAVSPTSADIVFVGLAPAGSSGGKLYRSTDGGDNWSIVPALDGNSVFSVAFTPSGTAYIGTLDSVWKSVDDGANWTQLNLAIGLNDQVFSVTIDPGDPETIWAGVADALGSQPANVMRSTNGGASWTDMTPPLGAASCRGIAIDPNNSDVVAACFGGGFGGGAIWVTTDGGESWINRTAGLPARPLNDVFHDGNRLLLVGGLAFGSQTVGVFSSTNLGATWIPLHDAAWPSLIINDVDVDPNDIDTIHVASGGSGVFRSTDGGESWAFGVGGTSSLTVNSIRFSPESSTQLFIGGSSVAVLRSNDAGNTFEASSVGIGSLNVEFIAANSLDASELAIAFSGLNDGGVYTSPDGGMNWTLADLPGTRFNFVAFAPDGKLYAVSDGPTSIAPEGLYRRNANGTWSGLGPNQGSLFESELQTIEFSHNNPGLILAAGSDFGVAGAEPTIWRTSNGGVSWNKAYEGAIDNDDVTDIGIVQDGTDFFMLASFTSLGAVQDGGVLRSNNTGLTWSPSETGLPFGAQCEELTAVPSDPNMFYLADSDFGAGDIHVTTDAGATWNSVGFGDRVTGIVLDLTDESRLFILQPNQTTRVQVSDDAGETFSPFNNGLSASGFPRSLAVASGSCPRLLLSSQTGTYATDLSAVATGDSDADGDVDLLDFEQFNECLGGGAGAPCCAFDFNTDGRVDWSDFASFQIAFTGGGG